MHFAGLPFVQIILDMISRLLFLQSRISKDFCTLNHQTILNIRYAGAAGLVMLSLILFTACNKCATDPILLYAGKETLSYGIFKPGTLWVYQNDTTGVLDSVTVTSYEYRIDTLFESCKDMQAITNYEESFYTYSRSSFYDLDYISWVKVSQPLLVSNEGNAPDTLFSTATCIDTGYCNRMDTFRVYRKKYPDVYERIDSSSELYDGKLVRFYSAPGYGLIRREILIADNTWETWSLIHSIIVQ